MSRNLYLLRHGSTGAHGRFIGSTDLPVSTAGLEQLNSTRRMLEQKAITTVFCSPLLRCRQTVDRLQLDAKVIEQPHLREIDFGAWEGLTFPEIAADWPGLVNEWASCSVDFTFPDGEKISDFLQRINTVRQAIDTCPDKNILVVAHGGVIRHLICLYLGLGPEHYLLFDIQAGCFSTLSLYSEGGILTSLNSG